MTTLLVRVALGAAILATPLASLAAQVPPSAGAAKPDLTRKQAQQRADALFQTFDMNHDGIVTRDEARQIGQHLLLERASTGKDTAPGIGGHTLKFLEHAFADAQSVTRQQLEQAMLAHFDAMDLNHDGVVTATEREQARAARVQKGQ
jgi:hypothetical protein